MHFWGSGNEPRLTELVRPETETEETETEQGPPADLTCPQILGCQGTTFAPHEARKLIA